MRKIIDLEMIKKYIEGDLSIEKCQELEQDYRFMMNVLIVSQDRSFYEKASDTVKNNYSFIKFLVNYFWDDIEFVSDVADNYLLNNKHEIGYIELLVMLISMYEGQIKEFYEGLAADFYEEQRIVIEWQKSDFSFDEVLDVGLGFCLLDERLWKSDLVMDFLAKSFVEELFSYINIKETIKNNFESLQELKEVGVNNFLINLIYYFDYSLAIYVVDHIYLLNNINNLKTSDVILNSYYIDENLRIFTKDEQRKVLKPKEKDNVLYVDFNKKCKL